MKLNWKHLNESQPKEDQDVMVKGLLAYGACYLLDANDYWKLKGEVKMWDNYQEFPSPRGAKNYPYWISVEEMEKAIDE